jgi:uncharacterized protein YbaR (Trm112 family)
MVPPPAARPLDEENEVKLDPVLLEILVCPDCKGSLTVDHDHDELICNESGLIYPVRDDIPVMLVDEARRPAPEAAQPADATPEPSADEPAESTESDA